MMHLGKRIQAENLENIDELWTCLNDGLDCWKLPSSMIEYRACRC